MMYSSMNLQAMYTGVISKYIQNSSLKVFEEVSVSCFVFFSFKKKERKKALFLQQTIEKEVSYLWRDSRLKVEGWLFFCFFFCSFYLYSWSPDYTWRGGKRDAELVIQYSHLPLEEEQGSSRCTEPSPDLWPATPFWANRGLIMTPVGRRGPVARGSGSRPLPPEQQQHFIVAKVPFFFSHPFVCFFCFPLKYVYTHTWLQRISDHNIITEMRINKWNIKH